MSEYTHRTIIVPAAFQQLAQGLCAIAALFDAIDVTALGPLAAMARLGLVMVQAEAVE